MEERVDDAPQSYLVMLLLRGLLLQRRGGRHGPERGMIGDAIIFTDDSSSRKGVSSEIGTLFTLKFQRCCAVGHMLPRRRRPARRACASSARALPLPLNRPVTRASSIGSVRSNAQFKVATSQISH